jgi:hypothetical protein
MNIKIFKQNVGKVIKFRPRPKTDQSHYLEERFNSWTILTVDDAGSVFQNTMTDHEVRLGQDSIREFREPDLVIVRVQIFAGDKGKTTFEPFVPAVRDVQDAGALAEPLNSDQVKEMLGEAVMLASEISRLDRRDLVPDWIQFCPKLIETAFGAGESALFLSNTGYVFYGGGRNAARDILEGRLRRLSELIPRITGLHVNEQLNVEEWKKQLQALRNRSGAPQ